MWLGREYYVLELCQGHRESYRLITLYMIYRVYTSIYTEYNNNIFCSDSAHQANKYTEYLSRRANHYLFDRVFVVCSSYYSVLLSKTHT